MRGRRPKLVEEWFEAAAALMVRHSLSLRQAALEQGTVLSVEESDLISRRKEFQRVLWSERQKYYKELASDPHRGKSTIIGRIEHAVTKLLDAGEWDKAIEGLIKLAKIEGLLGSDQNINIYGNLSAKDIAEVKKQIQDAYERERGTSAEGASPSSVVN